MTSIDSTAVLISWSPPFTLEGVPILRYIVTIASTTSVANVTVNNTLLYYLCHESSIDVTVVAVNGAGDGYPATFSELICPSPSRKSNYFLSEDIHVCIHYINMHVLVKRDKHSVPTIICCVTMIQHVTMGVPDIHLCI